MTTTESHILENSPSSVISAFIFYQVWEIPKLWSRSERNHRLRTTEDSESELRLRFVQCYKACIFALLIYTESEKNTWTVFNWISDSDIFYGRLGDQ